MQVIEHEQEGRSCEESAVLSALEAQAATSREAPLRPAATVSSLFSRLLTHSGRAPPHRHPIHTLSLWSLQTDRFWIVMHGD